MRSSILAIGIFTLVAHDIPHGKCDELPDLLVFPLHYIKARAPQNKKSGDGPYFFKINMEIWEINEISLRKQDIEVDLNLVIIWIDPRLSVRPNISSEGVWPILSKEEASKIWTPTLVFSNCKGCGPLSLSGYELSVNKSTGTFYGQMRLQKHFSCPIDLRAYPMDIQFCRLQIYTYQGNTDVLELRHRYPNKDVVISSNLTLSEYFLAPITKAQCVIEDAEGDGYHPLSECWDGTMSRHCYLPARGKRVISYLSTDSNVEADSLLPYPCLELRIRLEHLIGFHLMTLYAPTSFIVVLSWISFWLPVELAPARVALGLTSLLTLATRLDQAQKNLPPVAYVKAIDVWMFACIFLVSMSLCEFAISHYRSQHSKPTLVAKPTIKVRHVSYKIPAAYINRNTAFVPPSSEQTRNHRSMNEDIVSRILFPLMFLIFNIAYWSFYLTYDH